MPRPAVACRSLVPVAGVAGSAGALDRAKRRPRLLKILIEFALGGDPQSSSSAPRIWSNRSGGNIEVYANVAAYHDGVNLSVETSPDLIQWLPTQITPTIASETVVSQVLKWTVPGTGPKQFVRLRINTP